SLLRYMPERTEARRRMAVACGNPPLVAMTECAGGKQPAQPPSEFHSATIGAVGDARGLAAGSGESRLIGSAAAGECDQQGGNNRDCRANRSHPPAVFRRPTTADQQEVGGDHALDHRGVAEPIADRPLIKMLAMGLPNALAAQQP